MSEYVYCVSCNVGNEAAVADNIQKKCGCKALYPMFDREERRNGIWTTHSYPLVSGYVFVYADEPVSFNTLIGIEKLNRILKYDDDCIALQGDDLEFALWVLRYNGKIGISKAMMVGDKIKVFEGPLKDYEGVIKKVNKQRRSAMVEVTVGGLSKNIWMSFEWITEPAEIAVR